MEALKINPVENENTCTPNFPEVVETQETPKPQKAKKATGATGATGAKKLVKIKLTKIKPIKSQGGIEIQYGISFEVQDDGSMIGETFPEVAKAGIDAGLYAEF